MKDNEKENKTNVKKTSTVKKETTKKTVAKKSSSNVKKNSVKASETKPKSVKKETVKKNVTPKKTTTKVEPKKENTLKDAQKELDDYPYYPLIKVGFMYRFNFGTDMLPDPPPLNTFEFTGVNQGIFSSGRLSNNPITFTLPLPV